MDAKERLAIRELSNKRTQGELEAECIGSEGYTLRMKFDGNRMERIDHFGFGANIGEIRGGKDWSQLRGNAEYLVAAWNELPKLLDEVERLRGALSKFANPNAWTKSWRFLFGIPPWEIAQAALDGKECTCAKSNWESITCPIHGLDARREADPIDPRD